MILPAPLAAIAARYPWAAATLERATASFGEDKLVEVVLKLEKAGSFARAETNAAMVISGLIGQELLTQPPAPGTAQTIFGPAEAGTPPKSAAEA